MRRKFRVSSGHRWETRREIAQVLGVSKSGVNSFLAAFKECKALDFPLPEGTTNYTIANHVYSPAQLSHGRTVEFVLPHFEDVHRTISTRKNMTLVYIWNHYAKGYEGKEEQPYQYRRFYKQYAKWRADHEQTIHFTAVPGQKMEVDFAGQTFQFVDRLTGELVDVVVFVAVLPYSQYIYAEGMASTKEPQWIEINNHALQYFIVVLVQHRGIQKNQSGYPYRQ